MQRDADLIIDTALQYSYVSVIKMAMGWRGADGGYCRRPFRNERTREGEIRERFRALRDRYGIQSADFLKDL